MKKLITILFGLILLISCGNNAKIGKNTKEPIPENFLYEITKDESDSSIGKNQLEIEISEKLTEGQIATLAEELYSSKKTERRFYIFYKLKNVESSTAWAISHFDPELEIEILDYTSN